MSKLLSRAVLLAASTAVLLTALPAIAAPSSQVQPGQMAAVAAPANRSCTFDVAGPFTVAAPRASAPTLPEFLSVGGESGSRRFHGFCPCGCSPIPDCNTSADCFGGAPCRPAISCC